MRELRREFQASDGALISYVDVGEGLPFLWIHGWGGEAQTQLPLLRGLAARGFRCLCFDQRGCGRSPATPNLGVPRSAQDTKELLEHLEIDNAVVLGYSMGGAVLFFYLQEYGTRHLSRIIIGDMSPKPLNDDGWKLGLYQGWYTREQFDRDLYNMEHDYKAFSVFFAEQTMFPHTPDEPRGFEEGPAFERAVREKAAAADKTELLERLVSAPGGSRMANRIYWESCDSRDYRPALARIDVPAGLFFADPGSLYSPELAHWMARRIPDAFIHIFHGCTHLASGEKPEEFIQAIVDFAQPLSSPVHETQRCGA